MFDVPILLIVFNRPEKTRQVIQALEAIKPQKLYVAADGPRENFENDIPDCLLVRNLFANLSWPCEVVKLYQNENIGIHFNPRRALKWFFENVEEGIILEDDCVPGEDFFYFCKELLIKYRNDHRIFTINGGNLGYNLKGNYSYTYSRFMNMTGWASWRRSENAIDYDLTLWRNVKHPLLFLYRYLHQNIFDFDVNWYKYWKRKFNHTIRKPKIKWWDYQWIFYQITNKKVSIVPAKNLVKNIGFDETASSVLNPGNPAGDIKTVGLTFPLIHPPNIKIDLRYEEKFVKWIWCWHKRLPAWSQMKILLKNYFDLLLRNKFKKVKSI